MPRDEMREKWPCAKCGGSGRVEKYAHGGLYTIAPDGSLTGRVTDTVTCSACGGSGEAVGDE